MFGAESNRLAVAVSERDHSRGPADAPVTLVEYGDFECDNCGEAYPIVKELQARLRNRLRFVFRNFPLTEIHVHAEDAAEASEAAAAQGKFWAMHDILFENQTELDPAALEEYAARIGLDVPRFKREMRERVYERRVEQQIEGGDRSGVDGTPTFFINGWMHEGAYDLESLLEACEEAAAVHGVAAGPRRARGVAKKTRRSG